MARSARKHRIGNAHMIAALTSTAVEVLEDRGSGGALVKAPDDRGVILEIAYRVAAEDEYLRIIYHCQPVYDEKDRKEGENDE
ncbi:hypothetical protein GOARA_006_00220 [Gordonia araii NBRC 100433]|uniref:Uncharacterized protein n=1 Tax=Gordonia araii NBRC 100433 TaxID=1073574 RepID=G7GXD8_9ACTN|nr:hypothetical protein GOARA_006_00220 [Gordonia araii NBRC 100433]